jgi:putative photosynthetic complex assembly protein
MSDPPPDRLLPPKALYAIAALIGFSLLAVTTVRLTVGLPARQADASPTVQAAHLRFEDRRDGAVLVYDAQDGVLLAELPPATNGFIRGVLRSLVRERRSQDQGDDTPFRLARHQNGRLTLEDLATGRLIDLRAFGVTNEGAFGALLEGHPKIASQ